MPEIEVFHYTDFTKIGEILGKIRGETPGLKLGRRAGPMFPSLDTPKAIFGLLEPTPSSWTDNPNFPQTWDTLVRGLLLLDNGALLLRIGISSEDKVFVGERAHIEGMLYEDQSNIPKKFLHSSSREAEQAFLRSLKPITAYVSEASRSPYSLPEVVIFSPIPSGIVVHEEQPLIERQLATGFRDSRSHLISLIDRGYAKNELLPWRHKYEQVNGSLIQK